MANLRVIIKGSIYYVTTIIEFTPFRLVGLICWFNFTSLTMDIDHCRGLKVIAEYLDLIQIIIDLVAHSFYVYK